MFDNIIIQSVILVILLHTLPTDLRQLACTLFLRGEVENGLVIVRCLESYNAVPTVVGQAAVRGMVLTQEPLSEILDMINQFSEMTSLSVPVKVNK